MRLIRLLKGVTFLTYILDGGLFRKICEQNNLLSVNVLTLNCRIFAA